ncbi:MAG: MSCRAMM family protein [Solirubrobacteraceae bacterium]
MLLAAAMGSVVLLALAPVAGAQAAGAIQGIVSEAAGAKAPLKGVNVEVLKAANEEFVELTTTDAAGEYHVEGLPAGSYKVDFSPPFGSEFIGQFYKGASTFTAATPVPVTEGVTSTGINAELVKGATISGAVRAEGVGFAGAEVIVLPVGNGEPSFFGFATSKAGGTYSVAGVPPGEYTVEFTAPFGANLVPQFWNARESSGQATPVPVSGETGVEHIDANLPIGAQISGTVTDATTHQPVANVFVLASNSRGFEFFGGDAETDANGHYTIPGLATGSYTLAFFAEGSTEYLALNSGLIAVTQPNTTSGVNVSLTRAAPVNTSAPTISGTPTVGGQALSCSPGSWTGRGTLKFSYQWARDGAAIANATTPSYVVQAVDQGHGLTCQVTATNAVGRATAQSSALAVPAAPKPIVHPGGPRVVQRVVSSSVATVFAGIARLRLTCRGPASCVGTLRLVRVVLVRTRHGHRTIVSRRSILLAQGAYSIARGRSGQAAMRLTRAGRRRLAHARRHRLATTLVLTVRGGFATRQSVLLVRATPRRRH